MNRIVLVISIFVNIAVLFLLWYFYPDYIEKVNTIKNLEIEKENLEGAYSALQEKQTNIENLYKSISESKEKTLRNPSWQELKTFLEIDKTNLLKYSDDFDCSGFAFNLFKNARDYGFKAGYVEIEFEENTTGHAINVFNTTDKGLVFIDNVGNEQMTGTDKVAYIQKGQKYGTIDLAGVKENRIACNNCYALMNNVSYIKYSNLFDYSYFVDFSQCNSFYNACAVTYNKDAADFNLGIKKYTANQMQRWYANLDMLYKELGDKNYYIQIWNNTVKSVEIYW